MTSVFWQVLSVFCVFPGDENDLDDNELEKTRYGQVVSHMCY